MEGAPLLGRVSEPSGPVKIRMATMRVRDLQLPHYRRSVIALATDDCYD
jgi:hypothetical protein